jgi:ElaB/YqjD/DUF883 family membrane-anchored ribosome-binding protein
MKVNTDEILEKAADFKEEVFEKVTDVYEQVEDSVTSNIKQGKKLIKKYPLEAALAGIGIGFVLGILFSRRD